MSISAAGADVPTGSLLFSVSTATINTKKSTRGYAPYGTWRIFVAALLRLRREALFGYSFYLLAREKSALVANGYSLASLFLFSLVYIGDR